MQTERNVLIELSDGTVLAGDLNRPDGEQPTPTILCYYPYHKDDFIGAMYEAHANERLVRAGYSTLLVDFRGLGSSTGVALDGMNRQEGRDGAELVEWAAAQPWCDGNVGMWGLSYGAITSFKTAAEHPAHLRAIAPIMGSLDIYEDWVYPGGCRNMLGACGVWGSWMLAMQLLPPMLQDAAGRWHAVWRERLEHAEPYLLAWAEHPDHDEYWRERAVDAADIDTPTFLIGGWRDLFPETMTGAFASLRGPRKLLMGPWLHVHPDESPLAPIDHIPAIVRWFDRWLRGRRNGIEEEQPVQFYMQGEDRWLQSESWPPQREDGLSLTLGVDGGLHGAQEGAAPAGELVHRTDPTVGPQAGLWDPFGLGIGLPLEQSPDDLRSLCFTGAPLQDELRIAGSPLASVQLGIEDGADAHLVLKLCDVAPDGSSQLITTGWLNAQHRTGAEAPQSVPSGETLVYDVRLWATAYRLAAGHRLRLSVCGADFPRIWPSRSNPTFRLRAGSERSSLWLPRLGTAGVSDFEPEPAQAGVDRFPLQIDSQPRWTIERDEAAGSVSVASGACFELHTGAPGGRIRLDHLGRATVSRERPDGARVSARTTIEASTQQGACVVVSTDTVVTADGIALNGRVSIDGQPYFERRWQR